ncbi:3' terminal RNA ribose 2'-O-methyltransferase Hen1 [Lewinella cohaerens]|uniref:3' terminal RNA ribose 2'-O-methyltransferase Hen1 n=1 Tax=Lewinella cohaerens TaxID=70995 RepID=UPI00037B7DE9|nr:3' terminal RNA ribose 2'-O-methyltransferase Hen1 [Lewinella cohaerens]
MLLNITVKGPEATQLGYLLGKHPDKYQTKELNFGLAHIFFPEANATSCTATLLMDIDTTQEMRQSRRDHFGRNANIKAGLDQYVNDRAYVTSSLLTTAISKVYSSALNGTCKFNPQLIDRTWDIQVELATVCVKGNADLIGRLFSPLGYTCKYEQVLLDENFPNWGNSPYYHLHLRTQNTIQQVLQQLYILLPVLDNQKHYYFKEDEVSKLLSKSSNWLDSHPESDLITRRYFGYKKSYQKAVQNVLQPPTEKPAETTANTEEESLTLHQLRHERVTQVLLEKGVKTVLDLGCSSGKLLQRLQQETSFTRLTGADVAAEALHIAARRLNLDHRQNQNPDPRTGLIHAALTYEDERFHGYDAALLVEVIEHLDPERLPALEEVVFGAAQPGIVVITTPNVEYNTLFPKLAAGTFRHADHRFEWDRKTFRSWAKQTAQRQGYSYDLYPLGEEHPIHGAPSQMAVFTRT